MTTHPQGSLQPTALGRFFTCMLCKEELQEEVKFTSACQEDHLFCHRCIAEWYSTCATESLEYKGEEEGSKALIPQEALPMRCPICGLYGGYLPKSALPPGIYSPGVSRPLQAVCFCREDSMHFCYTLTGFNMLKPEYNITLADGKGIRVCTTHLQQYLAGKTLDHYMYGLLSR